MWMSFIAVGYMYHNIELGLDQAQAVPADSYLQDYFDALASRHERVPTGAPAPQDDKQEALAP